MGFMSGKRGLVTGVANSRSLAWGIGKSLLDQGAEVAFSYHPRFRDSIEKRLEALLEPYSDRSFMLQLDGGSDDSVKSSAKEIFDRFGNIDFILHSMAFAKKQNLEGNFFACSRSEFALSLDISVYSFISMAQNYASILNKGASLLTLSYLGSNKVMPNYNLMGIAKAALEASVIYLADDFGPRDIRVNALSAGPVKTLAGSGIKDFGEIVKFNCNHSPLRRNVSLDDIGKSGMYLLSDLSSGVTGETHYVDGGFNIIGMPKNTSSEERCS